MRKFYVKETDKYGKGLFAGRDFKNKEEVLEFKGPILTFDEIEAGSRDDSVAIQVGEKIYIGQSGKEDDFVNHSCDPSCGLKLRNGKLFLFAIKDIKKDEEITFDYSTSMDECFTEIDCKCESENCRSKIKDFKFLPKDQKLRYMQLGIVPNFININKD